VTALYEMSDSTLVINHSAGVFSCYTIRLEALLDYFRTYKRLPSVIDSSQQFASYKNDPKEDISTHFFETIEELEIPHNGKSIYVTSEPNEQQFSDYDKLNYADVRPFVEKYFTPSKLIREQVWRLERELPCDYQSTCGIRFRGTDKQLETNQPSYAELILQAIRLKQRAPKLKFLIQSDDRCFIEYTHHTLGDDCCFHLLEPTINNEQISDYVAAIIILSRCKCLITTSGNGELWARLFRGNNKGSLQWLSPKEYIYGIKQ
jgi:hypothetical protein